ncbi:hypothetical protein F2P81_001600 [Scophthalmus maximus]|uniref:Uncharacterized protein n=1 Tax=Scophthalmus maximus TaxID=52904 RepID=A0A6A4TQM7_SCOMX|nr:hypothetical protein F2P81_001600 [Scophthalmus maximus]
MRLSFPQIKEKKIQIKHKYVFLRKLEPKQFHRDQSLKVERNGGSGDWCTQVRMQETHTHKHTCNHTVRTQQNNCAADGLRRTFQRRRNVPEFSSVKKVI